MKCQPGVKCLAGSRQPVTHAIRFETNRKIKTVNRFQFIKQQTRAKSHSVLVMSYGDFWCMEAG
jgi:hypothetical protein